MEIGELRVWKAACPYNSIAFQFEKRAIILAGLLNFLGNSWFAQSSRFAQAASKILGGAPAVPELAEGGFEVSGKPGGVH